MKEGMSAPPQRSLYGILAEFRDGDALLAATRAARADGWPDV